VQVADYAGEEWLHWLIAGFPDVENLSLSGTRL
jgi:hypothetical protein